MSSQSWEGNLAAGSLPAFSSIIRSFFFLTTSSVSKAWNWQKSLFRHSAKELRGLFQKKLSAVRGHLCSGLNSSTGTGLTSRLGLATRTQPPRAHHRSPPGLSFLSFPVDPFLPPTGHLGERRRQREGLGSGFGFSPLIFLS